MVFVNEEGENSEKAVGNHLGDELVVHIKQTNGTPVLEKAEVPRLWKEDYYSMLLGRGEGSLEKDGGSQVMKIMLEKLPKGGVELHRESVQTGRFVGVKLGESSIELRKGNRTFTGEGLLWRKLAVEVREENVLKVITGGFGTVEVGVEIMSGGKDIRRGV